MRRRSHRCGMATWESRCLAGLGPAILVGILLLLDVEKPTSSSSSQWLTAVPSLGSGAAVCQYSEGSCARNKWC